jgi:hypothetical protein
VLNFENLLSKKKKFLRLIPEPPLKRGSRRGRYEEKVGEKGRKKTTDMKGEERDG